MSREIDLLGEVFGRLTVIKKGSKDKWNRRKWVCLCECGEIKEVHSRHLRNGRTTTCGCKIGFDLPKPYLGKKKEDHPRWKGGRFLSSDGYWMVYVGNGQYKMEHRVVMGVDDSSLVVHHKNHIKTDNRPENLQVMNRSEHAIEHNLGTDIGESGNADNLDKLIGKLEE